MALTVLLPSSNCIVLAGTGHRVVGASQKTIQTFRGKQTITFLDTRCSIHVTTSDLSALKNIGKWRRVCRWCWR